MPLSINENFQFVNKEIESFRFSLSVMYNRIVQLCKGQKITVKELEKALGFSNGAISHWKTSIPKADKVLSVADFFNVSVKYLLSGEEEKPAAPEGNGLSEKEQRIIDLFRQLSEFQQDFLIAQIQGLLQNLQSPGAP